MDSIVWKGECADKQRIDKGRGKNSKKPYRIVTI